MQPLALLLISLFLSSSVYAHPSLIPHIETESQLFHALLHTGIAIVLAVIVYTLVRKLFAPKRVSFKRNR